LGIGIFNAVAIGFLIGPVLVSVTIWNDARGFGLLNLVELPMAATVLFGIVFLDIWMYFWHRANHRIGFLWRFHKVHHCDPEMDATTSVRFHTGEILISALLRLGVVVILGLSLWQVLLYDILLIPVVFFHHSNVRFPKQWDRRLRLMFTSPAMHRIHHSTERAESDSNYGTIFSSWDRIFRSFLLKTKHVEIRYGIEEYDALESQKILNLALMPAMNKPHSKERT
jgi:sterol desaturase/sphingolipid hydroxylase (fatty acid hydroxylase superfamily)